MKIKYLFLSIFVRVIADNPTFKATCNELKLFDTMSELEKAQIQFQKLKETLVYAEKYVPYYRNMFAQNNFDPEKMCSFEELKKFRY